MKVFWTIGLAVLAAGLLLFVPWAGGVNAQELDFGENGGSTSGGGEFSTFVPQGGRALIGKIPVGITDLSIELTAESDLDIELWDGEVFVVGWEAGGGRAVIYSETETTGDYNGVQITYSGWNGVDGNLGNEAITLSGTTRNTFVMRAFGYEAGDVQVAYSWVGAGVEGPASIGSGRFSKPVPRDGRAIIGAIPAGVDGLVIDLTSANDLDIELWDGNTFVVGWQVDGHKSLIYSDTSVTGMYRGVRIAWSGWDGVGGQRGNESIRIAGTTQNAFLMKVYGYQEGNVNVEYSWGGDTFSPAFELPPAPVLAQTPAPTQAPTPAPTPPPTPTPTPTPSPAAVQVVKTWVAEFDDLWSHANNWSPAGVPAGDEIIVIQGSLDEPRIPIKNVNFTLTTGTINIGPAGSTLQVAAGVNFTNNGTIYAQRVLQTNVVTVNNGVYNNEATILLSDESSSFTNSLGGVLNNREGGSSVGVITNSCGGTINDSG